MKTDNIMTGKQLKAFAATVHDDAVIQFRREYSISWDDLQGHNLRASHTITAMPEPIKEELPAEAREEKDLVCEAKY